MKDPFGVNVVAFWMLMPAITTSLLLIVVMLTVGLVADEELTAPWWASCALAEATPAHSVSPSRRVPKATPDQVTVKVTALLTPVGQRVQAMKAPVAFPTASQPVQLRFPGSTPLVTAML